MTSPSQKRQRPPDPTDDQDNGQHGHRGPRPSRLSATERGWGPCEPALAHAAPRLRTLAPCCVLVPPLAQQPKVAHGPTGASVAYLLGVPPAVGTSRGFAARARRGDSRRPTQSLFRVSGFPQGAERP